MHRVFITAAGGRRLRSGEKKSCRGHEKANKGFMSTVHGYRDVPQRIMTVDMAAWSVPTNKLQVLYACQCCCCSVHSVNSLPPNQIVASMREMLYFSTAKI